MKGLINIQNKNNECFRWCLVRYLNSVNKDTAKIRKCWWRVCTKQFDFQGVKVPVYEKNV